MTELAAAVSALSPNFSGRLLQSSDADWDSARRVHNGLVSRRPALVAQCRGTADIVNAVRLAREQDLEIAVRGGGHNVGGSATVDDGIMIDLSLMKHVHVDPAARSARVAGGTLWAHVNRETQLHGLATTGGVVSSTGVAGLTLGGGLGWLMPKHGMALDNLIGVELVLADSKVVRASADENADLFWAVRGGGGNFGVASSLEFRVHPVGPVVTGGLVAWPVDRAHDVLRLFRDLTGKVTDDLMLVAAMITGPDGAKLVAIAAGHFGDPAAGELALAPIKRFGSPAMDAMGPIPYTALNAMLDASYPVGARNYWKSHFLPDLPDQALDALVDAFMRCPSPMGQVIIEHFHGAATRVAPSATAYALRSAGYNVVLLSQWSDASGDATGTAWARDSYASLQRFGGPRRYLNYLGDDEAGAGVLAAAYGPNVERLRSIKAKYDPHNVFHRNVNIAPTA
jgi:FAD/FMN-containing dehydrogenase